MSHCHALPHLPDFHFNFGPPSLNDDTLREEVLFQCRIYGCSRIALNATLPRGKKRCIKRRAQVSKSKGPRLSSKQSKSVSTAVDDHQTSVTSLTSELPHTSPAVTCLSGLARSPLHDDAPSSENTDFSFTSPPTMAPQFSTSSPIRKWVGSHESYIFSSPTPLSSTLLQGVTANRSPTRSDTKPATNSSQEDNIIPDVPPTTAELCPLEITKSARRRKRRCHDYSATLGISSLDLRRKKLRECEEVGAMSSNTPSPTVLSAALGITHLAKPTTTSHTHSTAEKENVVLESCVVSRDVSSPPSPLKPMNFLSHDELSEDGPLSRLIPSALRLKSLHSLWAHYSGRIRLDYTPAKEGSTISK